MKKHKKGSNSSLKATLLLFLWYSILTFCAVINPKLTLAIIAMFSVFIFVLIGTVIIWLGLRKYFEEEQNKKHFHKKHKHWKD
jgi:hypothetical protein